MGNVGPITGSITSGGDYSVGLPYGFSWTQSGPGFNLGVSSYDPSSGTFSLNLGVAGIDVAPQSTTLWGGVGIEMPDASVTA